MRAPLFKLLAPLLLLTSLQACKPGPDKAQLKAIEDAKIYKGTLNVEVDAGLEPVMRSQKDIFEFYYDSVTLNLIYKPEAEILQDFRGKKVAAILLSRMLDSVERLNMQQTDSVYARELPVAFDAVALVGNKDYNDSSLDIATLRKYFDPNISNPAAPRLVFDNSGGSIVSYMLGVMGYKAAKVSKNLYALSTANDVINYIQNNKNAIGLVPYNFLSDVNNDSVKALYGKIKVLSLRAKSAERGDIRVSANQSDIAEGVYPLVRPINAISRLGYDDNLEWLFVNFLYKGKASKVFLKSGLIPARRTEREINVNTDGLKGVNQ